MAGDFTHTDMATGNHEAHRFAVGILVVTLLFSGVVIRGRASTEVINTITTTTNGGIVFVQHGLPCKQSTGIPPQEDFVTKRLPSKLDFRAPDGSNVRLLVSGRNGSMAHFELPPGQTSRAVAHRTVEEIWYFLAGRGEMWRKMGT